MAKKIKKEIEETKTHINQEFDKTLKTIRSMVLKNKGFAENQLRTGYSYFKGNIRLMKLVYSPDEIILEINTDLDEDLANIEGMKRVSREEAYNKHMGTIKYLYSTKTSKHIKDIVKSALKHFKKNEERITV